MRFFYNYSATDEDFYSSLAQMAGDGFDDDEDADADEVHNLFPALLKGHYHC